MAWFTGLFIFVVGLSASAKSSPEQITLNRYLTITTCEPGQKCVDYSPQSYFSPVTRFNMAPVGRKNSKTTEAWDRQELLLHEVPIKSEIHFEKNTKLKKNPYLMTLHLKVGTSHHQRLQTKSFKFNHASDIMKKTIDSGSFPFKRGTMRVRLSIEPKKL